VPIIDAASANDPALAAQLRQARLIYLLGGFPGYLEQTLQGSLCWQAALEAYEQGTVLAGSSAGAMVLCEQYFDPARSQVVAGLNVLPHACFLPHHNTFRKNWATRLLRELPETTLIGVDEQTGMINDGMDSGSWNVYGQGSVTVYKQGKKVDYVAGKKVTLDLGE
jgi:cyanophycinase